MKTIVIYSQHVLGVGHLVRTSAIANGLANRYNVCVIQGGIPISDVTFDSRIDVRNILPICCDEHFLNYHLCGHPEVPYENIAASRIESIRQIIFDKKPDIFIVEGFPFGRHKFKLELIPILKFVRRKYPNCRICSSVRDILVKIGGEDKRRRRTIRELNRYFDEILVHSDPAIFPLELTFGSLDGIKSQITYTGFICRTETTTNKRISWNDNGDIIVSHGGGCVGSRIIETAVSFHKLHGSSHKLYIYLGQGQVDGGYSDVNNENIIINKFSALFREHLSTAAVSISMGGYNTILETIAARVPAVIIPFDRNDEQRIRADTFKNIFQFEVLPLVSLTTESLKSSVEKVLKKRPHKHKLNMNGIETLNRHFEK